MKKSVLGRRVWAGLMAAGLMGLASGCVCTPPCKAKKEIQPVDNAAFYKDGKFDGEKAKQAYFDLMKDFHEPVYEALTSPEKFGLDKNFFWAVDFAQGDFARLGMGGVIWVNEKKEGYFGHEIFLLPGQSIAEHKHLPTKDADGSVLPCKIESWRVRRGSVYLFSEVGTPNADKFPEVVKLVSAKQVPYLKSAHIEKFEADGTSRKLAAPETWHFMMGGPDGAVVTEYATFHDGSGLRFSVPTVAF
jgi:hypothetical protein